MYPKNLTKFRAWTKAMEANATVGTPDYGKNGSKASSSGFNRKMRKRRKRRKRKKNNA